MITYICHCRIHFVLFIHITVKKAYNLLYTPKNPFILLLEDRVKTNPSPGDIAFMSENWS